MLVIIVGTVPEISVVVNPGKSLGGTLVSGLVALTPEASEHNRFMLRLGL